jgi:hypothetical protein
LAGYSSVLTKNIKSLLHGELKNHFFKDPNYKENLRIVNRRSDLEDFTYGIYFRNITADRIQYGVDNYLGNVWSFVSIAKVGYHPSAFVNYVKEDDYNLYHEHFKENLSDQVDGSNTTFVTKATPIIKQSISTGDPFYADSGENVMVEVDGVRVQVDSVVGKSGTIVLRTAPAVGSTVCVTYASRNIVPLGYYFLEITAPNEIHIGNFPAVEKRSLDTRADGVRLSFPMGFLSTTPVGVYLDGVLFEDGVNIVTAGDFIDFSKRPQGSVLEVRDTTTNTSLESYTDWKYAKYIEEVLIESAIGNETYLFLSELEPQRVSLFLNGKEMVLDTNSVSGAYTVEGSKISFTAPLPRNAKVVAKYTYTDQNVSTLVSVDDVFDSATLFSIEEELPLLPNFFEVYLDGFLLLEESMYTVDYANKTLRFLDIPLPGKKYYVSYRLDGGTLGPFEVESFSARSDILPGVQLYFNNRLQEVGDKVVVIVGDQRKNCADEFGGKWQLNVDLGVVSPDPMTTEEIADELVMFLWALLKPKFDACGLFIEDVSNAGESEEELDESTGDTDFQASVSLVVQGDWFLRVPRKFRLMSLRSVSVSPVSDAEWEVTGLFHPTFKRSKQLLKFHPESLS